MKPNLEPSENPYDPDDPDNYMHRGDVERSPVLPVMFLGMLAVGLAVGLFVAKESPLTDLPWQTTENVSAPHDEPNYYR